MHNSYYYLMINCCAFLLRRKLKIIKKRKKIINIFIISIAVVNCDYYIQHNTIKNENVSNDEYFGFNSSASASITEYVIFHQRNLFIIPLAASLLVQLTPRVASSSYFIDARN